MQLHLFVLLSYIIVLILMKTALTLTTRNSYIWVRAKFCAFDI